MADEPTQSSGAGATSGAKLNVTTWDPGADAIEVTRSPAPGPRRGAWRAFAETARGEEEEDGAHSPSFLSGVRSSGSASSISLVKIRSVRS